jgi:hypothetical protein
VASLRDNKNACRVLMGKQEVKRSCGRHRSRWKDNIKIDPKKIQWNAVG